MAAAWPDAAERLGRRVTWPGPLTLVVPRRRRRAGRHDGGGPTVAVRAGPPRSRWRCCGRSAPRSPPPRQPLPGNVANAGRTRPPRPGGAHRPRAGRRPHARRRRIHGCRRDRVAAATLATGPDRAGELEAVIGPLARPIRRRRRTRRCRRRGCCRPTTPHGRLWNARPTAGAAWRRNGCAGGPRRLAEAFFGGPGERRGPDWSCDDGRPTPPATPRCCTRCCTRWTTPAWTGSSWTSRRTATTAGGAQTACRREAHADCGPVGQESARNGYSPLPAPPAPALARSNFIVLDLYYGNIRVLAGVDVVRPPPGRGPARIPDTDAPRARSCPTRPGRRRRA